MYRKELYEYRGRECTITELSQIAHLHRDTIRRRLDQGLTIEQILDEALRPKEFALNKEDIGKKVPIVFTEPLPVYDSMQPILGKRYIATICGQSGDVATSRIFFLIVLDNGKKLITYPGEFELVETSCKKINRK